MYSSNKYFLSSCNGWAFCQVQGLVEGKKRHGVCPQEAYGHNALQASWSHVCSPAALGAQQGQKLFLMLLCIIAQSSYVTGTEYWEASVSAPPQIPALNSLGHSHFPLRSSGPASIRHWRVNAQWHSRWSDLIWLVSACDQCLNTMVRYLKYLFNFGCFVSSCRARAQLLQPVALVAHWHVGSWFTNQGLNLCPLHCKADC